MAEDEDVNIIKKAEREKREIGIAEQNPHNRKKVRMENKEFPAFTTEHQMKNVDENAGLDENDNFIHRREQNQPKQMKARSKK